MAARPAAWLIKHHFARFLVGEDARNVNMIWDQLYRSSLPYGRKGLPIMAISAVDLALWDLVGKVRSEPVYNLIGGLSRATRSRFYCTGPAPDAIKALGFWGAKVPLPHSHFEGEEGLRQKRRVSRRAARAVGPDFPLMVDCYMSLTVAYAIRLAEACQAPRHLLVGRGAVARRRRGLSRAQAARTPTLKWTTGEHEYTRYGFRRLIEERTLDIVQPDVMWVGGLTELLRIAAHASAYDIPVVPHGSGPYSYHFIASQTGPAFCEYVAASPDGRSNSSRVRRALHRGRPAAKRQAEGIAGGGLRHGNRRPRSVAAGEVRVVPTRTSGRRCLLLTPQGRRRRRRGAGSPLGSRGSCCR